MARVLIVEDERPLLRNLESYLTSFGDGFEVITAATGEEGLQVLANGSPLDVLVCDVRLPGIDGIEVVRRTIETHPETAVIVMTAFGSEPIRRAARIQGAFRFVEKPLDLDQFRSHVLDAVSSGARRTHEIGGLDVVEVAQFLLVSGDTTLVTFRAESRSGIMLFDQGRLMHCSSPDFDGAEALFDMVLWGAGSFAEIRGVDPGQYPINVNSSTVELLERAVLLRRELDTEKQPPAAAPPEAARTDAGSQSSEPQRTGKECLMAIKDHLSEFEVVEGFQGAAIFTAQGEMLEGVAKSGIDIKAIGMFANNALLNSQKATDQMGVGRGNLMQIRAPKAFVIMRCLNEATDFAATKEGKAHIHAVVVMDPEGNVGMASIILDRVIAKVADEVR